MSTAQMRQKVKKAIDSLPADELKKLAKAVGVVPKKRPTLSAEDRRKIANMKRWIREADRDLAEGRTVNWRTVRRDV